MKRLLKISIIMLTAALLLLSPLSLSCAASALQSPKFTTKGGAFYDRVTVSITAPEGSEIHYTTNGRQPLLSSAVYEKPFVVTRGTTVKAFCYKDGVRSKINSVTYKIKLRAPTATAESGVYDDTVKVQLNAAEGSTIYYTTDGTSPSKKSTQYRGAPITIDSYTVLKAAAYKDGCYKSSVMYEQYLVLKGGEELPDNSGFKELTLGSVSETDSDIETKSLAYSWSDGSYNWELTVEIAEDDYVYYSKRKNKLADGVNYDYSAYSTDTSDDEKLAEIAESFRKSAKSVGYDDEALTNMIISFVQNISYVSDRKSRGYEEYPKYPLETLYDKCGDCEDSTVLLASLLKAIGRDVVLVRFDDHIGVGITGDYSGKYFMSNGKRYYYIETTTPGWNIGQIPDGYSKGKILAA